MGINCEEFAKDETFNEFMTKAEIMGIEWISKFLRNKYKIRRDLTKYYSDLSILIHESVIIIPFIIIIFRIKLMKLCSNKRDFKIYF